MIPHAMMRMDSGEHQDFPSQGMNKKVFAGVFYNNTNLAGFFSLQSLSPPD
jgi:hypothetical protein